MKYCRRILISPSNDNQCVWQTQTQHSQFKSKNEDAASQYKCTILTVQKQPDGAYFAIENNNIHEPDG